MTMREFQNKLVTELANAPLPKKIRTEKEFEKQFIVPVVLRISAQERNLHIYSHPWNNRNRCQPDCLRAREHGQTLIGCPQCWRESKSWASVGAFGTHHDFDLMARDTSGRTLAIEAKLLDVKGRRMPNGEIQRFIGQCFLAGTKHDAVIGLCGYRGSLNPEYEHDTPAVKDWLERVGIALIFRAIV